jgi:hypothetical protein
MSSDSDTVVEEDAVEMLELLQLLVAFMVVLYYIPEPRRKSTFFDQRLAWNHYCEKHQQQGTLTRRLRMKKESFDKPVLLLKEDLIVNEKEANRRGVAQSFQRFASLLYTSLPRRWLLFGCNRHSRHLSFIILQTCVEDYYSHCKLQGTTDSISIYKRRS